MTIFGSFDAISKDETVFSRSSNPLVLSIALVQRLPNNEAGAILQPSQGHFDSETYSEESREKTNEDLEWWRNWASRHNISAAALSEVLAYTSNLK